MTVTTDAAPKPFVIHRPSAVFSILWVGLLVSYFGSGLSTFAVGAIIYQRTGSVTEYSLFNFFYYVPLMALSPFAGAFVDRWERRWGILFSEIGAGVSAALLWVLLIASDAGYWKLEMWHFYVLIALSSAFVAFHGPAFYATIPLLVPKQQLGRANGLMELAFGAGQILSPLAASLLVGRIGLSGIVFIDVVTFALSILSLLFVRFPQPPPLASDATGPRSMRRDITEGWSFIRERAGLFQLMLFMGFLNLCTATVVALITPLVLSFADVTTLGKVMSFAGVGMVVGGIGMSVWGGPKHRMHGVLGFYLLSAFALLAAAMPPTATIVAGGAFAYLMCSPAIVTCMMPIWQSKVPPALQGRVFSVRRMITLAAPPVATLIAGPLSDYVFEPWLAPNGWLAGTVGRVIGTGPGRGIGFFFVVMSVGMMLLALLFYLSPRLRNVEEELPDLLPEQAPGDTPPPADSTAQAST